MSQQSIKRRIEKMEEVSARASSVYFPNADGHISDEYRPGIDILFITIYEGKDGKPSADQPNLKWRGQTYAIDDENLTAKMIAHMNDNPEVRAKL